MKRFYEQIMMQDSVLSLALIAIVVACGFALLHALGGAAASTSPILPLYVAY